MRRLLKSIWLFILLPALWVVICILDILLLTGLADRIEDYADATASWLGIRI